MDNEKESLYKELAVVQKKLNAPKSQWNNYGKYSYRSTEDILLALKEIMPEHIPLTIKIRAIEICGFPYIKATAFWGPQELDITGTGLAREDLQGRGNMDSPQSTGSASSYATKRALGNLFMCTDEPDSDTTNIGRDKPESKPERAKPVVMEMDEGEPDPAEPENNEQETPGTPDMANEEQIKSIIYAQKKLKWTRDKLLAECGIVCKRPISSSRDLTYDEALKIIQHLGQYSVSKGNKETDS